MEPFRESQASLEAEEAVGRLCGRTGEDLEVAFEVRVRLDDGHGYWVDAQSVDPLEDQAYHEEDHVV